MKKCRKQLHRVAAMLLGCVLFCCPVFADDTCSLRVSILDDAREPVEYINVEVCQVTAFDGTEHTFVPEYAGLGIAAAELDASLSAEQAEAVYQYACANGISGTVCTTNAFGAADFSMLEKGIYLVFDRGGQRLTFQPYLVELPTETPVGALYNVHSEPKAVSADSRTLLVAIEWIDDGNRAGKRPEGVEVTLLRQAADAAAAAGTPLRSVVLNEACRWQHTFHTLSRTGEYGVEGSAVPEYTLVEIEAVAEGYVLIYEYTPTTPTPPGPGSGYPVPPSGGERLPQTGFRLLGVYGLLGSGTIMVVLGMVDLCVKKKEAP